MRKTVRHQTQLDQNVWVKVRFVTETGRLTSYAVTLIAAHRGRLRTVRVYDNAHGINEMHRYTRRRGKKPGEVFHYGSASAAMNDAQNSVSEGWEEMVKAWLR